MTDTIEQLFAQEKGHNTVTYKGRLLVRLDRFPVVDGERIRIVFEHVGSRWSQAVRLRSDTSLEIDGDEAKDFALWFDNAPAEIICTCRSKVGEIRVYNAWDSGKGSVDAWIGHAAMIVEELPNGRRYRCNDGYPDDDFDDLVFRIERIVE